MYYLVFIDIEPANSLPILQSSPTFYCNPLLYSLHLHISKSEIKLFITKFKLLMEIINSDSPITVSCRISLLTLFHCELLHGTPTLCFLSWSQLANHTAICHTISELTF